MGSDKADGRSKAELLKLSTFEWFTITDYPFSSAFMGDVPVLYLDGNFYIFGGFDWNDGTLFTIARLGAYSRCTLKFKFKIKIFC